MAFLTCYTRKPDKALFYDPKLAYSMHLAISGDASKWTPLNHNSGVLFARATENEDGSLHAKSLRHPFIFQAKGNRYGVVAVRTEGEGEEDESSRGQILVFSTNDFVSYEEIGLLKLSEDFIENVECSFSEKAGVYTLKWSDVNGKEGVAQISDIFAIQGEGIPVTEICGEPLCDGPVCDTAAKEGPGTTCNLSTESGMDLGIEGAVPCNMLKVPETVVERLSRKLLTPRNIGIEMCQEITVSDPCELMQYTVDLLYSDGTKVSRHVKWAEDGQTWEKGRSYKRKGKIWQEHFEFPVAINRADPCIGKWHDKYYFIATNDADGNHSMYIRRADTIDGLVDAQEHLILDSQTYPQIGGLLWAPEFHVIENKLYIFHAATPGEFFWEESHVMELREGGDPTCKEDWSVPHRVLRPDGKPLCLEGKEITLDMTHFVWQDEHYVIWSQRQFQPIDLGAWLYIAKLNPHRPWQLLTEPVVLSKPDYGWGNNHTFVEEGPFALIRGDKLYVTFSAAAIDESYVVALLGIEKGKDLLIPGNWKKSNYPILSARSVEGEYGTGHNAYVEDERGLVWNTYHARPGADGPRSSGIRRVHFDIDGEPMLDVTEDLDVDEKYADIEVLVHYI